jgi:hypothetical protein
MDLLNAVVVEEEQRAKKVFQFWRTNMEKLYPPTLNNCNQAGLHAKVGDVASVSNLQKSPSVAANKGKTNIFKSTSIWNRNTIHSVSFFADCWVRSQNLVATDNFTSSPQLKIFQGRRKSQAACERASPAAKLECHDQIAFCLHYCKLKHYMRPYKLQVKLEWLVHFVER